ncbi:MAG: STAS domain-containing protein [Proteobacteria bacterium]|nr:STAS domain-containing protein [Pseudomonadota bacterium]
MSKISVSEGRVCIIKVSEMVSVKEGLDKIKNALIDFTTSEKVQDSKLDTYIFLDLTPFNIINSSLIGILGSIIMDPKIQLLALCGVQPSVADILKRFGVVSEEGKTRKYSSTKIKNNLSKVFTFKSIEEGLICLNPA